MAALETANDIIHGLLKKNFFVYDNSEMAVIIGYIYLTKMGVSPIKYSLGGINEYSSIQDIRNITRTW